MAKVKVKGPIGYGVGPDGKTIEPGTVFEVEADEANHLIAVRGFELVADDADVPRPQIDRLKLAELQVLAGQYGLAPEDGDTRAVLIEKIHEAETKADAAQDVADAAQGKADVAQGKADAAQVKADTAKGQ